MSAIVEVLSLVKAGLGTAGLTVEVDRQEDDKIAMSEGDVVALSWQGADASQPTSCSNYFWTAQIAIEAWAVQTSISTLLERMTALLATVSGVFAADPTFGGKFHDCFFTAVTGMDDLTGDRGTVTLTATIQYWTARSNITVISTD